jgi:hypothetical protein
MGDRYQMSSGTDRLKRRDTTTPESLLCLLVEEMSSKMITKAHGIVMRRECRLVLYVLTQVQAMLNGTHTSYANA